MFISVGEDLYGAVDRVPGHFYVATPFIHICGFPIFPGRSYLVLHSSRVDPSLLRKRGFAGHPIYWSLKSIVMAWFRALLAVLSLIAIITAMVMYWGYFSNNDAQALYPALIASESLVLLLAIYWLSRRLTVASRRRLVAMARRLEGRYSNAALVIQSYLKDSGLLESLNIGDGQDPG